jgi:serine/threonine-protein kinase ULK/ATG1
LVLDFGLSKVMTENTKNGYFCGSFIYMAPEMIIVKEFDIKADLWSIGVILYECLFEHTPYSISHTASIKKLFANIRKQNPIEIPSDIISPKCRDLLLGLLQHDPINRMNHKQFYIHPFIDLDHSASEESLSKGVKAAAMATHLQWESRFAESYISYIIALEYIIPYYKGTTFIIFFHTDY